MLADTVEKIAKALADKTRVKILEEIMKRDGLCCMEAMECAALSQPTISHHIKILTDSGLVKPERMGRKIKLKVNKKILDKFTSYISNLAHA